MMLDEWKKISKIETEVAKIKNEVLCTKTLCWKYSSTIKKTVFFSPTVVKYQNNVKQTKRKSLLLCVEPECSNFILLFLPSFTSIYIFLL